MQIFLNQAQAKGLSNFLFDMAKGLILGSLGLALTTPFEIKIVILILSIFFAFWFIKIALSLLEEQS